VQALPSRRKKAPAAPDRYAGGVAGQCQRSRKLGRIGVYLRRCSGVGVVKNRTHWRPYEPKSNRATGSASFRLEFRQSHLLLLRAKGGHQRGRIGQVLIRFLGRGAGWHRPVPRPYKPNSGRAMAPTYQPRCDGSFTSWFRSSDRRSFGPCGCCRPVAAAATLSAHRRAPVLTERI